jgi:hypothetical protein
VTVEQDDTPATTKIGTYIGKAVKSLMIRAKLSQWPKEKIQAKYLKIKEDEIIPRITKAIRAGRMTKKDAKAFYRGIEENETKMSLTPTAPAGNAKPVTIDWNRIPDTPAKALAASKPGDNIGTRALVVLDSFAKKTQIPGRVVESSPLPKSTGPHWLKTGTKAYDLHVGVDWEKYGLTPGENLRPGMGGKVTLVLDEIENALTVPVLSVYNKKDRYYCKKMTGGSPVETEIEIGKMNESRVQILSGLAEGDKVLLVAKSDEGGNGEDEDKDGEASGGGARASE